MSESIAAVVVARLSPFLGPNVARMALKTFAQKTLGVAPEAVKLSDAARLLEGMKPMLAVMLSRAQAETLIAEIQRELSV